MASGGGFSFGNTASAGTGGFNFGTAATPAATTTAGSTGISFGATSTVPTAGIQPFGVTPAKTQTSGLTIGIATPSTVATSAAGATTGFSLGLPAAGTTPSLGASTGFSLNAAATKPGLSSGLTLNTAGLSLAVPTTGTPGLSFPAASSAASTGLSSFKLGATSATTGGLGGGLFNSTTSTAPSIFNNVSTTTTSIGLGGVDTKTSAAASGGSTTNGKSSDVKALKETMIPDMLNQSVDSFHKYIKDEKVVREGIARMSSKPLVKVQEDTAALKQLLSVVSNTLQRNTCAVEKLKREMTQELKNAEMAHRTKDTPPGLQYENTAPNEYFQILVEDFESRMLTYRQQIEILENHLTSLHQPSRHSPAELIALLRKLHETFVALAAQLQQVHEAVKTQKEHYLNYRKIFHGDTKNIFERQQKSAVRVHVSRTIEQTGPNPFTGLTNATAVAMASVLTRSQQPSGAPPIVGLTSGLNTSSLGFGLGSSTLGTSTLGSSTLGGGGGLFGGSGLSSSVTPSIRPALSFGSTFTSTPIKPLGSTGGLFGSSTSATPAATTGFGLGTTQPTLATPSLGVAPFNISSSTNQPFTLDKPPGPGGKRNKR
ncbi:nucleoporin p58/p45 isoform X1 [Patella vulgata]|uniref:nucleoporin p58/p45 isoform X1 n=2 Tax=Patella vulgata TaxID=6465 RepID=UPI0024A97F99|nr:nucleoporin p58/p45 isoform X1 [Patella vulgata]